MSKENTSIAPNETHVPLKILAATYAGALLLSALLTYLLTRPDKNIHVLPAVLQGWGLALLGAVIGSGIKKVALRRDFGWFMIWAFGINGIRALLFMTIIVAAHHNGMAHFRPFLLAALTGYFCCLYGEVLFLHLTSLRTWSQE